MQGKHFVSFLEFVWLFSNPRPSVIEFDHAGVKLSFC